MRHVILYIAMSLDGYIADTEGGVAWLRGDGSDPENEGSYAAFYDSIDTVILGYKTYRQIATELSPDGWIYSDKKSYVLTHRNLASTEEITFTQKEPSELLSELKNNGGGNIWICGGAEIVNQLLESDQIDRYCISIIPTILGDGVPLFHKHSAEYKLQLLSTRRYDGIVDLVYERRIP
ncbi:dihydrofolate reductase family protein [Clostridium sp. D33t1_170424_F3]|uniref:dihydrofolate reductase family protein n=1 Tax=Clostridium sp. D33t1_170424_F3 TaxID=2787099 RepID=UPI0018AA16F8|nr:dihydrofolate reductase family protein [Clostridium sp. D33t1_170424_F3]